MLFQNKNLIVITFTTLVIGSTSIGGIVNAEEYRYPSPDVLAQAKPVVNNAARPAVAAQPGQAVRTAPVRPMPYAAPYPGQRNFAPMPPYGRPYNTPYNAPRGPYGGPVPMQGPRPMAGPAPMQGPRPMPGPAPMQGPRPMPGPAPMQGPRPMPGPAPMQGPRPMPGPAPMQGPGPRTGPTPVQGPGPRTGPGGGSPQYGARPYNSGRSNSGPFGGNNPMDNFGFGPFNRDTAPWETWPFGGRDSLWNKKELPFKGRNPADWFDPADPKEGLAIMWEDLISAPDDLGEMPGGWYVPSISVPNPVDLEDQLERASKEVPDLIRIYN